MSFSLSSVFFSLLAALGLYVAVTGLYRLPAARRVKPALGQGGRAGAEADSESAESESAPKVELSDLRLPLAQRVLAQPLADIGARFGRQDRASLEDRLRRSGWRYRSVGDYYGSKVLGGLTFFTIAAVLGVIVGLPLAVEVLTAALAGLAGLLIPDFEIRQATDARRKALFREMAWTLDRLAVIMETGLGFDTALQDLTQVRRPGYDASAAAGGRDRAHDYDPRPQIGWIAGWRGGLFLALLRDLSAMLATRPTDVDKFLSELRSRVPHLPELDEFVHLILASLSQKQPIVPELKALAAYMRDELINDVELRRQDAERRIIMITTLFMVPALLIVIGGPAMIAFLRVF